MAPSFEPGAFDKTVQAGSEAVFKCKVFGEPDPQVVWLKDGKRLKTTKHMKLTFTDDNWCHLTIHACEPGDAGLYICSASNSVGAQSTQCNLTVIGMLAFHFIGRINNTIFYICMFRWRRSHKKREEGQTKTGSEVCQNSRQTDRTAGRTNC